MINEEFVKEFEEWLCSEEGKSVLIKIREFVKKYNSQGNIQDLCECNHKRTYHSELKLGCWHSKDKAGILCDCKGFKLKEKKE